MKNENNNQNLFDEFEQYYIIACRAQKCKTQADFAKFCNLNARTVQRALTRDVITPKTLAAVRLQMEAAGLVNPPSPVSVGDGSVFQSPSGSAGINSEDHRVIVLALMHEIEEARKDYTKSLADLVQVLKTDK